MTEEYFSQLSIPVKRTVDKSTPMSCLKSMGLLSQDDTGLMEPATESELADLQRKGLGDVSATVWDAVGGVEATYIREPIVLRPGGDVDGPSDVADLERAPIVYCLATCHRTKKTVVVIFALNRASHTADVCVYDPLGPAPAGATEENMYEITGTLGAWLRDLLGDGWGLRMEVYHERYAPTELAGIDGMSGFWLFIVCLLKMYLPHVRMVDTQAALRVECLSMSLTIKDVVMAVLHQVHSMIKM